MQDLACVHSSRARSNRCTRARSSESAIARHKRPAAYARASKSQSNGSSAAYDAPSTGASLDQMRWSTAPMRSTACQPSTARRTWPAVRSSSGRDGAPPSSAPATLTGTTAARTSGAQRSSARRTTSAGHGRKQRPHFLLNSCVTSTSGLLAIIASKSRR
jgi:hypothetical protein